MSKDWGAICSKIIDYFDILKKILSDRAVCSENQVIIFDPPYTIKILKQEEMIVFQLDDEDVAVLSKKGLVANDDETEKFVEEWCTALTSLGFKRYLIKKVHSSAHNQ